MAEEDNRNRTQPRHDGGKPKDRGMANTTLPPIPRTQPLPTAMPGPGPAQHLRSRTGCWTCRLRKKKCDEVRPVCNQCCTLRIQCDEATEPQPAYMKNPEEARQKKVEIKTQMGKRRRRRRRKMDVMPGTEGKGVVDNVVEVEGAAGSLTTAYATAESGEDKREGRYEVEQVPTQTLDGDEEDEEDDDTWDGEDGEEGFPVLDVPSPEPVGPGTIGLVRRSSLVCSAVTVRSPSPLKNHSRCERSLGQRQSSPPEDRLIPTQSLDPFLVSFIPFKNRREIRLLKHYIYDVCAYTYRSMSESDLSQLVQFALVPRCQTNRTFLHACINSGLLHLCNVARARNSGQEVSKLQTEIAKYNVLVFQGLTKELEDGPTGDTLANILGVLNFEINAAQQTWEIHLNAATELIAKLGYINNPFQTSSSLFQTQRVIWLDIMAACTQGSAPRLWASHREFLSRPSKQLCALRLQSLTGVADEVLYLLSEALCLEQLGQSPDINLAWWNRKATEIDERLVRAHPTCFPPTTVVNHDSPPSLPSTLSALALVSYPSPSCTPEPEPMLLGVQPPHEAITVAFILATRIHIWSIRLGFHPHLELFRGFLRGLVAVIGAIPTGTMGCDRCIVWPLLVGGSLAETVEHREFFVDRVQHLEPFGAFSFAERILREVWSLRDRLDARFGKGKREVHWRKAMKDCGCRILMG